MHAEIVPAPAVAHAVKRGILPREQTEMGPCFCMPAKMSCGPASVDVLLSGQLFHYVTPEDALHVCSPLCAAL